MHKGKIEIEIVEVPCRRCGKSIRTLKRSLLGANELREITDGSRGLKKTPDPLDYITRSHAAFRYSVSGQSTAIG